MESLPCSTKSSHQLMVKPSAQYQFFTQAEGNYTRGRGFPTLPWRDALLPLFLILSLLALTAIVFCSSPPYVTRLRRLLYKKDHQSDTSMLVGLGALILFGASCFCLSGWAQLLVWKHKHSVQSMRRSETVNTLRSSYSADLGRYHWILEHASLTQHFTVNENKVESNDLWFSRYGKSLYVNIPISVITYWLTDPPWCCRSYYLCSNLNLQDPYSSFCSTSFMSWCWESQPSAIKVYQDSFRNHSYRMNIYKDIMIKIVKIEWVDYSEMLVIMCSW